MKPAGPKSAFAESEEVGLDADLDSLDAGDHAGAHASPDKLPDADFFNGAGGQMRARRPVLRARLPPTLVEPC